MPRRPHLPPVRPPAWFVALCCCVVGGTLVLAAPPPGHAARVPADCRRAPASAELPSPPPAAPQVDAPAALTTRTLGSGAWSYFGDPRAVAAGPWVYTGWITRGGNVRVARFRPGSQSRARATTVGHTGRDDHNNPSFTVTPGGRITVFFSPHAGRYYPLDGPGRMYYRTTRKRYGIGGWTRTRAVPVNAPGELGYTYPNLVRLDRRRLFVAWRGGCWRPTFSIRTGGRWSPAREIVRGPRGHRPYAKYAAGRPGSGVVHLCYTEGHPKDLRTGVHCVEYVNGQLRRADGTRIARLGHGPIRAAQGDSVYRYSRRNGRSWVMGVADDGEGRPVVLFTRRYGGTSARFMFGRWTGAAWRVSEIGPAYEGRARRFAAGHFQTGGATFDPRDPFVAYLGRIVRGRAVVEKWQSVDHGETWARVQQVSPAGGNCFRPAAVRHQRRTTVLMVCGRLRFWLDFRTTIKAVTLTPVGTPAPPVPATRAAPAGAAAPASAVGPG